MFPDSGSGSLVITASRRLARHLRLADAARHRSEGRQAWPAIRYLPWEAWLRELWVAAAFRADPARRPVLLSARQAGALWYRSVRRALGDADSTNAASLAAQAAAAWQRASDWRVPLAEIEETARGIDARLFAGAARHFRRACEAHRWQDPARLAEALVEALGHEALEAPARVTVAGFERFTPVQKALLDALDAHGAVCERRETGDRCASAVLRSYANRDEEMLAAGGWARERLCEAPDQRVAIVVPGLSRDADRIGRLVAEGFNPGWQLTRARRSGVNVSYGRSLAEYGLIDAALSLLRLLAEDPDFLALSRLLRSPYLSPTSLAERARFEVELRQRPDRHWPLAQLRAAAGRSGPGIAGFLETLARIGEQREEWRQEAWPARWGAGIDEILTAAGWGEGIEVDSDTYQLVNAWRSLLNELSTIGRVTGPLSGIAAIRELEAMARDTLFQPESAADSLPVLGLLEASGLDFDALWIAGMDASTWPPPQRPDPLLPLPLQREYGMPDATPDDTLAYAQLIFRGLVQSATEVVVSWPRQDGEALLAPSPLADGYRPAPAVAIPDYFAAGLAGTADLRRLSPDPAPPVDAGEEIPGGHGILSAQRTQPFDAFAGFRLRARPLDSPPPGLSARDRGNIVHRVLETLYRTGGAETLDPASLSGGVDRAVARALSRYRAGADARLLTLLELEAPRIAELVRRFLAADARRGVITAVIAEEPRGVRVGPLTLNVRPDRIDAVPGGWLIIDYKTGVQGTTVGKDPENPNQLQLVTYALSQHGNVRGLAIAVLHPHRVGFTGVRDAELDWPDRDLKAVQDWPGLLNAWKAQAHSLAEAVATGDARLNMTLKTADQRAYAVLSRYAEVSQDA